MSGVVETSAVFNPVVKYRRFIFITVFSVILGNDTKKVDEIVKDVFIIDTLYYQITVDSGSEYDTWSGNLVLVFHTTDIGHMTLEYEGSLIAGLNQSAFGHRYKPWDKHTSCFVDAQGKDTLNIELPVFYSFHYIDPILVFSCSGVLLDNENLYYASERVLPGFNYFFSDTLRDK